MVAGKRFDLEAARAEARAKKQAEKIKKIVSAATLVIVVLAIVIGGKIGWSAWQDKRQREQEAAEAARLAEEKAEAERRRVENERREAERARREAERKAENERREAERKAKAEAREAERKAREEARQRAEEEKRRAAENKVIQKERREAAEKTLANIRFKVDDHIVCAFGTDDCFDIGVDERRWVELSTMAQMRQAVDFFNELKGKTVTDDISESNYPDRETIDKLLENLNEERFTFVVQLTDLARYRNFVLVGADPETGLKTPDGCRELKNGAKLTGWTVPFRYGDETPLFLMERRSAEKLSREWNSFARKVRAEGAKLDNREIYIADRLQRELPDFVRSVKVEISTPPPEEKKPDVQEKREIKPKATLKGSMKGSSDIRRMNGPQLRR